MTRAPNETLRQHVTGTAFLLSLGKTHITALVVLDHGIRNKTGGPTNYSHFITGVHGLKDRGLIEHHHVDMRGRRAKDHIGRHYTITKAGRLVRDLLKEAGLWQEYEAGLGLAADLEVAS